MKQRLLSLLLIFSFLLICNTTYSQDTDGDGTANNLDQDEDNDGVPDKLDGCSTIDIDNTIGIGNPVVDNSTYAINETNITYNATNATAFYGYVAGNQGNAIRMQGPYTNEQLEISFSVPVINLTFKITDYDDNEQVTVNAYDELDNLISLSSTSVPFTGTYISRTGNLIQATGSYTDSEGDDEAQDGTGAAYLYFSGQISRIVFISTLANSSIRITEFNYCLTDSDNDGILNYRDVDSDNDGIPDIVEAGGVDIDGDGYVDDTTDNNGNGIPDIYDYRCTNSGSFSGYATTVHNSVNTNNPNNALGSGINNYAELNSGGAIELRFTDVIPAGNSIVIRQDQLTGSGTIDFTIERSVDGITYSNSETFTTSFNGIYAVSSYNLLGGNTQYVRISNLSTETLGIDYANYNFGAYSDCSGIYGLQITNFDHDFDGYSNSYDLDSDSDGIYDVIEAGLLDTDNDGLADSFVDTDGDGFNDNYDGDVGNDGSAENTAAAVNTGTDTNSDGVPNSYPKANFDNNGFPNPYDIDSDDDGIPDNIEAQTSTGYIIPAGTFNSNGTNTAYSSGITPEDTDGDGIADYLDTDSDDDGTPDIQENGDVNSISNIDIDLDGLDDTFDSNTSSFDVNDEVTSGNTTELSSVFGDIDGDLLTGGDLDYRDLFAINPPASAALDFDGVDDYFEIATSQINSLDEFTLSFWIKPEFLPTGNTFDTRFIIGQKEMFEIILGPGGDNIPKIWTKHHYGTGISANGTGLIINDTDWMNYTVTVDYVNELIKIYVNGAFIANMGMNGSRVTNSNPFRIGSKEDIQPAIGENFEGWIDEVKLFDTVLTSDQIQQMIYQEIENNAGTVHGSLIDQDISDSVSNATIPWSNLIGYYPMTNIQSGRIPDESANGYVATLHNMNTFQPQSAPMPFETKADGNWADEATWLHGDVWDIEDFEAFFTQAYQKTPEPYSIVKIHHNINTSKSHEAMGMFIDNDITFVVNGDNAIINNRYLQLDGTLDLADDSQLIQGPYSDLVTSATGKILRRQEGNTNVYWYNYWSSPVGSLAATTLTDNNAATNNSNNTPFNLNMLKDGTGAKINFTNAYNETGKISRYWLNTFQNGQTYYDWVSIDETTPIAPGLGYSQKGTGNPEPEQQYIFEGKPNNGTITLLAEDIPGDSANESSNVPGMYNYTSILIGNPYPSALDARKFIADNVATIQGTIQLWKQWDGNSHYLAEYQGGYGYINLLTTVRAYQYPGVVISDPTDPEAEGIKLPTFYIPVGQGFFVEVTADTGNIEFNNGQRVFKKEALDESIFFRSANTENTESGTEETAAETQILRMEFEVSSGASRSFVIGFTEDSTDEYDNGLDGGLIQDPPDDDMGSFTQWSAICHTSLCTLYP